MGYLCPVCEEPFADSQQCANHLAVTAILHGDHHEVWLADAVDTWTDRTLDSWESIPRSDLAELVADHADETDDYDHPGEHTHSVDHAVGGPRDQPVIAESTAGPESLDADARAILREAHELSERIQERGPTKGKES